ncbi:MAG: hypothetical protein NTY31_00530 [Candidatus Falkowbacteria bacterium]|nr:hypothetical protein [Candidatus Falkowbacteria bacterium]
MRKKIIIPKNELTRLYYKENKSKYKIGNIYGCSFSTVLNRMREYGFKPLSRSVIQSKYTKKNFSGDKKAKAYMLGFRLGDLNVYKTTLKSEVIITRCHTTNQDQVDVMNDLFKKYGQVTVKKNDNNKSITVNCFLNDSFDFLLPKSDLVEEWITENNKFSLAFAAGYIDAEANIGVYDKRARFKIDSYDKNTIFWFFNLFKINRISCPKPIMIGRKGQIYNKERGYKYNKDLWRIRVSESKSLEKFLKIVKPYLKHKKRIADLNKCLININDRRNK